MGRLTVKVPDVGEGVAEVELVSWAVVDGQPVERNQIVAEVMTDKATVEVPSPVDGVIGDLAAAPGDRLLVGEPLFRLEVEGEGDEEVEATVDEGAGVAADTGTVSGAVDPGTTADARAASGSTPADARPSRSTAPDTGRASGRPGRDRSVGRLPGRGDRPG